MTTEWKTAQQLLSLGYSESRVEQHFSGLYEKIQQYIRNQHDFLIWCIFSWQKSKTYLPLSIPLKNCVNEARLVQRSMISGPYFVKGGGSSVQSDELCASVGGGPTDLWNTELRVRFSKYGALIILRCTWNDVFSHILNWSFFGETSVRSLQKIGTREKRVRWFQKSRQFLV